MATADPYVYTHDPEEKGWLFRSVDHRERLRAVMVAQSQTIVSLQAWCVKKTIVLRRELETLTRGCQWVPMDKVCMIVRLGVGLKRGIPFQGPVRPGVHVWHASTIGSRERVGQIQDTLKSCSFHVKLHRAAKPLGTPESLSSAQRSSVGVHVPDRQRPNPEHTNARSFTSQWAPVHGASHETHVCRESSHTPPCKQAPPQEDTACSHTPPVNRSAHAQRYGRAASATWTHCPPFRQGFGTHAAMATTGGGGTGTGSTAGAGGSTVSGPKSNTITSSSSSLRVQNLPSHPALQ